MWSKGVDKFHVTHYFTSNGMITKSWNRGVWKFAMTPLSAYTFENEKERKRKKKKKRNRMRKVRKEGKNERE